VVKDNLFEIPPLFKFIHDASGTDLKEMYKVFNMGHRMEIYLPAQYADQVISISKSFGIEAQVVGNVQASPEKKVTLRTPHGEFIYS
jgi:phosphoribosylformylglycinamidine cyclo-ligase